MIFQFGKGISPADLKFVGMIEHVIVLVRKN
jgi:hypothetical protein